MHRSLLLLLLVVAGGPGTAADDDPLAASVAQLRHAVGTWHVTTEFLDADGNVARSVPGTYRFRWVVEDRVVAGESELPDLGLSSGILFYVNERNERIEMVSVGPDGRLWIMSGPLGGETRHTQEYETAEGQTAQLRFTRYNVERDRFESRMEYTSDGGVTWLPGNHQVFERAAADSEEQ